MEYQITKPEEVIESAKQSFDQLLQLIENEIKANKASFNFAGDFCLNVLVEDCPQGCLTTTNLNKLKKLYEDAGWVNVTLNQVEEFNRLRVRLYKY